MFSGTKCILPAVFAAGYFASGFVLRTEAAPAECLFVNANPGSSYGDRSFTNITWGDGYPTVSVTFVTDPSIVFTNAGEPKQRFANNGLTPGSLDNDNPDFISVYTNNLRLNATIADTGTVITTYTFSSPMTLVDLLVCDVDDLDVVQITPYGPGGDPLPPSIFEVVEQGDLSLTNNAGGRPPLELATPPIWNETSGVLTSVVSWNENRTYTILRVPEGIAVKSIKLEFTGHRRDTDGPGGAGLGSHIYIALWATPRALRLQAASLQSGLPAIYVPTLPGLFYEISSSSNLVTWSFAGTQVGPAAPTGHVAWVDSSWPNVVQGPRFYRFGQYTNQ